MTKKTGQYQIPFRGSQQLAYDASCGSWQWEITRRDNFVFEDTVSLQDFGRGRSAAYFMWTAKYSGMSGTMFMKDLAEVLTTRGYPVEGLKAKWTFVKRGTNYGLRLADEEA